MAQQVLNIGSTANDGTGDPLRTAMDKVNDNFDEIYASPLFNEDIVISGNEIRANRSNDDLVFAPSGTGSIVFPAIRINDNNIEATRSNDDINLIASGTGSIVIDSISIKDNVISTNASNADLELSPSGTGQVIVPEITIDSNINIKDNEIKTTVSNSDLKLTPSGTGQVLIAKADINGGTIDNTVIGGTTAVDATFTTLNVNTKANIDGVSIKDNQIFTNQSNADLELSGNGLGSVRISNFRFPLTDGTAGQFLKTDGFNNLGFATAGATLSHSDIADSTSTIASSATTAIDTVDITTYRSAKYFVSVTDSTNSRFEIVELNVVHDGTNAYISTFGTVSNYGSNDSLSTYSADISGGNVRVLATNISDDSCVFKFQRIALDL
jgi:hypothetical protein